MHVLCPSCAAQYEIPQLQRPRKLRCARCSAEWRVAPTPEPPLPAEADGDAQGDAGFDGPAGAADPGAPMASDMPAISLSPMVPQAGSRFSAHGLRRLVPPAAVWPVLWALSGLVIGVAAFAFWHWRAAIGHAWPPSLRLYRLLPGGS